MGEDTNLPQKITSTEVDQAWRAFNSLQWLASQRADLRENPYFEALKDTAFARFMLAYEAME